MAGPRISLPVNSPIARTEKENAYPTMEMGVFLQASQSILFYSTRSGTTAERPNGSSFRWTGMAFFDTTLGLPIFLKTASSNAWVKADGTAA